MNNSPFQSAVVATLARDELSPTLAEEVLCAGNPTHRKPREWCLCLLGFAFLAITLWCGIPRSVNLKEYHLCRFEIPNAAHFTKEEALLTARRALTIADSSSELQLTLAQLRKALHQNPHDRTAELFRFYLIYSPILIPEYVDGLLQREEAAAPWLTARIDNAQNELRSLHVNRETAQLLEVQCLLARWQVLAKEQSAEAAQALDSAWIQLNDSTLRRSINAIDLKLFLLRKLCNHQPYLQRLGGSVSLGGKQLRYDALCELYNRLSKRRNQIREAVHE
ncbi:MAG: hypothetical protein RSB14_02835 [Kiritimatiellia bacterium]